MRTIFFQNFFIVKWSKVLISDNVWDWDKVQMSEIETIVSISVLHYTIVSGSLAIVNYFVVAEMTDYSTCNFIKAHLPSPPFKSMV